MLSSKLRDRLVVAAASLSSSATTGGRLRYRFRSALHSRRLVRLTIRTVHFVILVVYRPGTKEVSSLFFDELSVVLETLVVYACPVVIGGDFNVKV